MHVVSIVSPKGASYPSFYDRKDLQERYETVPTMTEEVVVVDGYHHRHDTVDTGGVALTPRNSLEDTAATGDEEACWFHFVQISGEEDSHMNRVHEDDQRDKQIGDEEETLDPNCHDQDLLSLHEGP